MLLFEIVCVFMICMEYHVSKRAINIIAVFSIPYMIVIPINNIFMVQHGFYKISEQVIYMILGGLVFIFIGAFLVDVSARKRGQRGRQDDLNNKNHVFDRYKFDKIAQYTLFVEIVTVLRLLYVILVHGLNYLTTEDFSGVLISGPFGHLFLTIYPLIPIQFYYWLKHKTENIYLVLAVGGTILLFLTFVKYHVIGMVVLIYLFCAIEDSRYLKIGSIALASIVILLFVFNYALSFFLRGTISEVNKNFYLNHLWNYIAGSLIYDNNIFLGIVRNGVGTWYKIGTFLFGAINIFVQFIIPGGAFRHQKLPHLLVADNGEKGNVVDAIGYLFPCNGELIDYITWAVFLLLIGIIFNFAYNKSFRAHNGFHIQICVLMTFFMFFSFFGTFFIGFMPWEILLWSFIVPKMFDKRVKVKIGTKRIL